MLDDRLYGLLDLARRLGIPWAEMLELPLVHVLLWRAYFERRAAEGNPG